MNLIHPDDTYCLEMTLPYERAIQCCQKAIVKKFELPLSRGFNKNWSSQQVWIEHITDYINKQPLVPFLQGGRGSGHVLPQKIVKFQSPKRRFSVFWGLNLRTKKAVFHRKNVHVAFSIIISHTINSYKQWTSMSKVANPFWQPSVLIETPAYP